MKAPATSAWEAGDEQRASTSSQFPSQKSVDSGNSRPATQIRRGPSTRSAVRGGSLDMGGSRYRYRVRVAFQKFLPPRPPGIASGSRRVGGYPRVVSEPENWLLLTRLRAARGRIAGGPGGEGAASAWAD